MIDVTLNVVFFIGWMLGGFFKEYLMRTHYKDAGIYTICNCDKSNNDDCEMLYARINTSDNNLSPRFTRAELNRKIDLLLERRNR